eukprot:scaffold1157_cov106-Isochrysis_galbana.AAC.1
MTDPPIDDTEAREQDAPGTTDAKHRAPVHGHTGDVLSHKALSDSRARTGYRWGARESPCPWKYVTLRHISSQLCHSFRTTPVASAVFSISILSLGSAKNRPITVTDVQSDPAKNNLANQKKTNCLITN